MAAQVAAIRLPTVPTRPAPYVEKPEARQTLQARRRPVRPLALQIVPPLPQRRPEKLYVKRRPLLEVPAMAERPKPAPRPTAALLKLRPLAATPLAAPQADPLRHAVVGLK